jgi:hypothetical protein
MMFAERPPFEARRSPGSVLYWRHGADQWVRATFAVILPAATG